MVLSALCGSVIGIGMGFRIDVLICLPAFLGIVLLFIPDPFYGSIRKRLSAVLCCLFAFVIAGGPILVHITTGGNKGHPTMLGFMAPYSQRLGVGGTPYELAHRYLDIESLTIINAFARHENHDSPPIIYETDQFEGLASRYLSNYMKTCPADVLVRTYAATLRVLDELRAGPEHPVPIGVQNPVAQNFFRVREWVERLLLNRTRYVALLILCLLSAYSLRTGFATLGMLLYFAGYSAIQYGARNTFHLEIIPLWFAGALLTTFITLAIGAYQKKISPPTLPQCRAALFRVVAFLVVLSLGLAAPLYLARSIQTHNLTRLFNDYLTAPRTALASVDTTAADGSTLMTVPVLESCSAQDVPCYANDVLLLEFPPSDAETQVTFKYESDCFETNQTRTVSVPASKDTVRLLSPVYAGKWTEYLPQWIRFIGLEIPQTDIMRLPTVSHLDNPEDFPLILHMLYTPDWDEQPLYQQFLR
jgi:hypothetical protein